MGVGLGAGVGDGSEGDESDNGGWIENDEDEVLLRRIVCHLHS